MLNRSATSVLKALPGKLDIKRHSPSIHFVWENPSEYKGLIIVLFDYWIFHNRSWKIIGQEVSIDDRL